MSHPEEARRSPWLHFVYATGLVALSLFAQYILDAPLHVQTAFQMSLLVIALIAFLYSNTVALFAVFLSALGQNIFFLEDKGTLWINDFGTAVQYSLFILVSLTLCYVIDRLKRARSANDATLRELIRSNRARQLSDLRLDAGLNSIDDPILLLHPVRNTAGAVEDFTIEYLNSPAAALTAGGAAARESLIGKQLSQSAAIHLQHHLVADYIAVLESGVRLDREVLIEDESDRKVREVQVRAHRVGDSVVVHWRDVSVYRHALSTRIISEGRYKSLVEAIGAIVWNTPPNGEFETPQIEWSVFTGQKFEDLRGWGWLDAVHPDDRARTAQQWAAAMANHRSLDIDHRLRRSDGQYRSMHARAVPILDAGGNVREWIGVHTDVTERKRAEEIIADNERQLRRVLNALYTFVTVLTPDGVLLGANDAPLRASNIKAEDVIGKRLSDTYWLNHSEASIRRIDDFISRARNGDIVREDVEVRLADGSTAHIDLMLYPMRDENGVITNLIASGVDISDRKLAEAQLADSERHYRQLIEGMPIMSWSCTPEGSCDFLNAGWEEYTGMPIAELLGSGWLESVHPDDRQLVVDKWGVSVRTITPMSVEFRIRSKDGEYRWHDTRAVPLHDAAGKLIKWFGTNMDIDGRRRAEQRFRRLYESNLVGIVFYNADRDLFDANDAFLSILGYEPGETVNLNARTLTPPEWQDVDREQWQQVNTHGKSAPFKKQFFRKDGTRVNVMIAAADIDPGNHDEGVAFVVDLTSVERIEEALRQTEANLRMANESLENRIRERTAELQQRSDQLRALALDLTETESRERKRLAQVLHDHFQQLVSAAKLKVGIIRRKMTDPALLETLSQAESLLAETIDASRNLATELSPPVLHDGGLRAALEWLVRKMERDHELRVELAFDPECEPDNEQMRIILFECARELLFNVVKHAGTPFARLDVSMSREGLLQLTVSDEGKGFDPNVLESASQPDGSFGLLSIKERLALLGGIVRIRSSPDEGTASMISVPFVTDTRVAPRAVAGRAARSLDRGTQEVPRVRVIVADDHRLFREGLISLISQESFVNVIGQANDGVEAVELVRKLKPDILLCDITMPRLNGIQVAAQLSRDMPDVKVIGLSMHEREDMARAMTEAGAVAYCTKGGPTDTLLSVLRDVAATIGSSGGGSGGGGSGVGGAGTGTGGSSGVNGSTIHRDVPDAERDPVESSPRDPA